jgi:hypothetical protein
MVIADQAAAARFLAESPPPACFHNARIRVANGFRYRRELPQL